MAHDDLYRFKSFGPAPPRKPLPGRFKKSHLSEDATTLARELIKALGKTPRPIPGQIKTSEKKKPKAGKAKKNKAVRLSGQPRTVPPSSRAFRQDPDVTAFIADRCILKKASKIAAGTLYAEYERWCREGGKEAISKQDLGRQLTKRDLRPYRKGNVRFRIGIGLKAAMTHVTDDDANSMTHVTEVTTLPKSASEASPNAEQLPDVEAHQEQAQAVPPSAEDQEPMGAWIDRMVQQGKAFANMLWANNNPIKAAEKHPEFSDAVLKPLSEDQRKEFKSRARSGMSVRQLLTWIGQVKGLGLEAARKHRSKYRKLQRLMARPK